MAVPVRAELLAQTLDFERRHVARLHAHHPSGGNICKVPCVRAARRRTVRAAAPALRCGGRAIGPCAAPQSPGTSPRLHRSRRAAAAQAIARQDPCWRRANQNARPRLDRSHRARLVAARKRVEAINRVLESSRIARCWSAVLRWCAGPMAQSAAAPGPSRRANISRSPSPTVKSL